MSASLMDLIHQAGFTGNAANTMYAIVMAESGGNATAHNGNAGTGDNSYGLAQINMLGSMGPQRLQQFGLSSNDALYDPLTNLKVAYALSNHGTDFSPWTTYTRGTYKQYLGQSGASVDTSGVGGVAGASPSLTASDYEQMPGMAGLLTSVPELKAILHSAIYGGMLNGVYKAGGWSEATFQQAVEGSHWYRENNAATRQLISLKYSDPAQYKQQMGAAERGIENTARQLGVKLSLSDVNTLAYRSITGGWDNQTLQNTIGSMYKGSSLAMGQAAQIQQQLQQLYGDYGVPMSQSVLDYEVKNVLDGGTTMDTYKQYAMNTAKSMYPSLSSQIDAGMTVKSLADPYIQQMGNILEINPNQIGLTDPLIKKALQGSITTTGSTSTTSTTPLWQFEQTLRADPRWSKTNNARDTVSSALTKIGSDFGFAVA